MASLAIVVVSYNTQACLVECLTAIDRHAGPGVEVVVVDNASSDGSVERVRRDFPQVRLVVSADNLGFGPGNNLGVLHVTAPWLMLLNSDAILLGDTASRLVDHLERHPEIACVGPRIVLPRTGELQPKTFGQAPTARRVLMQGLGLNRVFPNRAFFDGIDGETTGPGDREVGWLSGVCMVMRTADYRDVGGFDARFFMYCEDIDLCIRLGRRGRIVRVDAHDVMHYGGASSRSIADTVRNSVWQQRHLLTIVRDQSGWPASLVARAFVAMGLVLRLLVGAVRIPRAGIRDNRTLRSAWSRLRDLVRLRAPSGA